MITADDPGDVSAISGTHRYPLESLDLTYTQGEGQIEYTGTFVPFSGADTVSMRRRFEQIGSSFDIVLDGENRPFRRLRGCQLLPRDPTNYVFTATELNEI